jgi:hypothetical protein
LGLYLRLACLHGADSHLYPESSLCAKSFAVLDTKGPCCSQRYWFLLYIYILIPPLLKRKVTGGGQSSSTLPPLPTFPLGPQIASFWRFLLKLGFLFAHTLPLAARTKMKRGACPFYYFFTPTHTSRKNISSFSRTPPLLSPLPLPRPLLLIYTPSLTL